MIRISCPRCHNSYGLNPELLGQSVMCQQCNLPFVSVAADQPKAASPPPPPPPSSPPSQVKINCPRCQTSYGLNPELLGQSVMCQLCGVPFVSSAPNRGASPPPPPPKPPANRKSASSPRPKSSAETKLPPAIKPAGPIAPVSKSSQTIAGPAKKKKTGLILALLALFIMIGGGGIGAFFLFGSKKTSPSTVPNSDDKGEVAEAPALDGPIPPLEIPGLLTQSTVLIRSAGSLGTGVLIHRNPNVIVTNHHVVGDWGTPIVYFPVKDTKNQLIRKLSHYETREDLLGVPGVVKLREPFRDLAFLQVEKVPDEARAVPMAMESARESESVYGVGQSGVDFNSLWLSNTGTVRVITQLPLKDGAGGTFQALLSQQPINPGDSGGPVVNSRMELVGIVSAKARKSVDLKNFNVTGLDNFSIVIDISEVRMLTEEVFRLVYKLPFQNAPVIYSGGRKDSGGAAAKDQIPTKQLVKDLEKGTPDKASQAAYALKKRGPEAVPMLVASLKDTTCQGRWPMILQTLELIGESAADAVDPAISCLRQDHLPTKVAAARFLGAIAPHGKKSLEDLWSAVASTDTQLRREAKNAILQYGPYEKRHLPDLRMRGAVDNPFVKASIVSIMCSITAMDQMELRTEMTNLGIFESKDTRLRALMATVIQESPDRFSRADKFRSFLSMMGDSETSIQDAARHGLDEMTWDKQKELAITDYKNIPILNSRQKPIVVKGYRPASKNDPGQIQLRDETDGGQFYVDSAGKPLMFCKIRRISQEDIDFLLQVITKTTPEAGVLFALQLIQSAQTKTIDLPRLKIFIDDTFRSPAITAGALQLALDMHVAIDPMLDELLALTTHQDQRLKVLSTSCLALLHKDYPPVLEALFRALEDTDSGLREAGETALASSMAFRGNRFVSSAELKLAERVLRTSQQPQARRMAARILGNGGEAAKPAFEALLVALDDQDYLVRVAAVIALAKFGKTAEPAVRKLADFVTHKMDEDNAMFTTDENSLRSFNRADARAMSDRLEKHREEIEKKLNIASDKDKLLVQNNYLRRLSLETLASLGGSSKEALPEIQKVIRKKVNHELLMMALGSVRRIAKDAPGDNSLLVEECLNLFKYEADSNASVEQAVDSLIEANGRKRAPVSNGVIETIQAIGAKSQTGVKNVIDETNKRVVTGAEALPATGGIEALILLFANRDIVPDGPLSLALAQYRENLRKQKEKVPKIQGNREILERLENRYSRVNLAIRLMEESAKKKPAPK